MKGGACVEGGLADRDADHGVTAAARLDRRRLAALPAKCRPAVAVATLTEPHAIAAPLGGRVGRRLHRFDRGRVRLVPRRRRHGMLAQAAANVELWGYCAPTADKTIFHCFALLRDGTVIRVPQKPVGRPT
jgi:hypothetical protein